MELGDSAVVEEDVEKSSEDSENDDEESSESSSGTESEEASDDSVAVDETSEDEMNVWDTSNDEVETEEAVEAGLQSEYMRALQLMKYSELDEAREVLTTLAEHNLFNEYRIEVDDFDWESAQKNASDQSHRISSRARLFASIHYNIARLTVDSVQRMRHTLLTLTIHPIDEELWNKFGEYCMSVSDVVMALFAFENCQSIWSARHNTVLCLYKTCFYEDCLLEIKKLLAENKQYITGLVLKDAISQSGLYMAEVTREVFGEDPMYVTNTSAKYTKEQKDRVMEELSKICFIKEFKPERMKSVRIMLPICHRIDEIGIRLCDWFDRVRSSESLLSVKFVANEEYMEIDETVVCVVDEMVDCVHVLSNVVDNVSRIVRQNKTRKSLTKHDWNRRSTRFLAEFNVSEDEESKQRTNIREMLTMCSVMEKRIIPLSSMPSNGLSLLSPDKCQAFSSYIFNIEEKIFAQACMKHLASFTGVQCICNAVGTFLRWLADNCSQIRHIVNAAREVVVQCYLRWASTRGDVLAARDEDWAVHLLGAELGCQRALIACNLLLLKPNIPNELRCKMHWALAIKSSTLFPSEVRRYHMWNVYDLLMTSFGFPIPIFTSVIRDYEFICVEATENFLNLIDRRATIATIEHLYEEKSYDKVIRAIEEHFNWMEVSAGVAVSTVLKLIDSYLRLNFWDKASIWLARALDYIEPKKGLDSILDRLFAIDSEAIERKNLSNLVHYIVPLILDRHATNASLWIWLYKAASILETESASAATVRSLLDDGQFMVKMSLNVLVEAHEVLGNAGNCDADGYKFCSFALREFAKIRSEKLVEEVFSESRYAEQQRAFNDEVYQIVFCMTGCPTRRKRALNDHGGSHDFSPTAEDAELILLLMMPDQLPSYDGSVSFDMIEVVQKKLSFYLEPMGDERLTLEKFDAFISQSNVSAQWPQSTVALKARAYAFYHLALHCYRTQKIEEAAHYAKLCIISPCISKTDRKTLANVWTMLAFVSTSLLFSVKEEEVLDRFELCILSFRTALYFEPSDTCIIYNFGSALYQIRARLSHLQCQLRNDDHRFYECTQAMRGLLEDSQKPFLHCISHLVDGDFDKWRSYFFLGKIAEKFQGPVRTILEYYYEAARQLEFSGIQYPVRVSTKKQENIEAIEVYYRPFACSVKRLLEMPDSYYTMNEILEMHSYAEHFLVHGKKRLLSDDAESRMDPDARIIVAKAVYLVSKPVKDVECAVYEVVERVHLVYSILKMCMQGFEFCVKRFPHFKSYYRLAQLALFFGKVKDASKYIFDRLLLKRRPNVGYDNIFENVIPLMLKDFDRGDSLQFHFYRIALLAINIASKLNHVNHLITLLRTFATLSFNNNQDFFLPKQFTCLYGQSYKKLFECVKKRLREDNEDAEVLVGVYDLYQYVRRNNEEKLVKALLNIFDFIGKETGAAEGVDVVEYCKKLQSCARKKSIQKKRAIAASTTATKACKTARLEASASSVVSQQ